jgi:hypothetical protein
MRRFGAKRIHAERLSPPRPGQRPLCRDGCAFYLVRDQAARRSWHLDHATETASCQWSRGPDGKGMSRWFIREHTPMSNKA